MYDLWNAKIQKKLLLIPSTFAKHNNNALFNVLCQRKTLNLRIVRAPKCKELWTKEKNTLTYTVPVCTI